MQHELARNLGRFARERASVLILDAKMIQIMSDYGIDKSGISEAMKYTEEAASLVMGVSATARLRLRFLLARARLHRGGGRRAAVAGGPGTHALRKKLFDAAERDLLQVDNAAKQLDLSL